MYRSRVAEYTEAFLREQTSSMRHGTAVPGSHSPNNTHGSSVACSVLGPLRKTRKDANQAQLGSSWICDSLSYFYLLIHQKPMMGVNKFSFQVHQLESRITFKESPGWDHFNEQTWKAEEISHGDWTHRLLLHRTDFWSLRHGNREAFTISGAPWPRSRLGVAICL